MKWQAGTPNKTGWYAVLLLHSDRPLVLWWSPHSADCWRAGATRMPVEKWLGPLPERGD